MTEDAVKRAVQGAARQAFAMGMQAGKVALSEREANKQKAVLYAEELVMPIVGMAIQEALEANWIEEHGRRHSAPDAAL